MRDSDFGSFVLLYAWKRYGKFLKSSLRIYLGHHKKSYITAKLRFLPHLVALTMQENVGENHLKRYCVVADMAIFVFHGVYRNSQFGEQN